MGEVVTDSPYAGVVAPAAAAQPPQLLGAMGPASAAAAQPPLPAGTAGVQTSVGSGASVTNQQFLPAQKTSLSTYPPTAVDVDLHSCITKNMPLWKSAWSTVFQLVSSLEQISATLVSSSSLSSSLFRRLSHEDMSDLMGPMMDMQMALRKCNIDPTDEVMLLDAIETGKVKTNF